MRDGAVVIGVRSSGIHSNGLSLARKAFFQTHGYAINHKFDELAATLGEELLRPTDIYVPEAMEILQKVGGVKALINITSDGLLNLTRVAAPVGYEIDRLIEPHPIFPLIQRSPTPSARSPSSRSMAARRSASAPPSPTRRRSCASPRAGLAGQHKRFWRDDRAARPVG